ncbi:related to endopolyphosphatase [Cephalotrichum gorgonifer]|uniref:Endopolyphosphatase n=1 Tax=Cephalotrichum gorgonifer TaxID=2041049 RepID=A0AAE8MRM1_9PEZI|nr:related to endopolyphosphatase [Cephalotrichum gorgonifer]
MDHCYRLRPLSALVICSLVASAWADGGSQTVLDQGGERDGPLLANGPPPPKRELHGKFLHITDFHPDEHYKPYTSEEKSCHRGKGTTGVYGSAVSECDSSYSLVNDTFDWIAANLKDDVDFVIWTGDSARHDNDEKIPRTADEVLRSNQYLVDRMKEVFADERNPNQLAVPIIPNIGNNDFLPHNILLPGPNKWLSYYAEMWGAFIPEEQRHSFEFGGWYDIEVIPNKLSVFSLNTMYFFDRNAGVDDCTTPSEPGFKQMEWLRIQLQQLRERGMKAILLGHVPPVKTPSKQLWDETCWQKYNLWMQQYRDVVVGSVYGHMNIDHFVLHDTRKIDIGLLGGDTAAAESYYGFEDYGEDEVWDQELEEFEEEEDLYTSPVSSNSKASYLEELRRAWSKLPEVTPLCKGAQLSTLTGPDPSVDKKKGRKGKKGRKRKERKKKEKKLGGKWAERYHVSFVSPSIVPNFFPTLRVIEYNITGLEDAPTWTPAAGTNPPASLGNPDETAELNSEVRQARALQAARKRKGKKRKGKKGKKGRKGRKGRKGDPSLVVPDPPTKNSPPGPAYSPQPLTWTGYSQYYANITRINEGAASSDAVDGGKARKFGYEVEYDTFSDKLYGLKDMTVRNYVRLAYRIGMAAAGKKGQVSVALNDEYEVLDEEEQGEDGVGEEGETEEDEESEEFGDEGEEVEEEDEEFGNEDEAGVEGEFETESVECQVVASGKREKRKKRASERAWRRFLRYAFVSTGFEEETIDGLSSGVGEADEREAWDEL